MDGAEELLDRIKARRDRLQMLTMNVIMDHETKWRKMDHVGISRWFDETSVHMVRHKSPEKMLELCGGIRKDRCYMVGNSYNHDIVPALEAGINAVYIPRPRYKRLLPQNFPDDDHLIVLRNIRELLEMYDDL